LDVEELSCLRHGFEKPVVAFVLSEGGKRYCWSTAAAAGAARVMRDDLGRMGKDRQK
jgi:hypothetical protein